MTQYLTVQQTAEALGIGAATVYRMLPRLGAVDLAGPGARKRLIRIPAKAIEAYAAGNRIREPTITKAPCTTKIARRTR